MAEVGQYLEELGKSYEAEATNTAPAPVPSYTALPPVTQPVVPPFGALPVTLPSESKSRLAPVQPDALRLRAESVLAAGYANPTERELAEALLALLPYKERYEALEQALASQGFTHQ